MNTARLLLLADFLETEVPLDRWEFDMITSEDWDGKEPLSECDSAGCALGWASSIPALYAAGFTNAAVKSGLVFPIAASAFDLVLPEVRYLFDPYVYSDDEEWHRARALPHNATPKDVAARIRAFVANGGAR